MSFSHSHSQVQRLVNPLALITDAFQWRPGNHWRKDKNSGANETHCTSV